MNSYAGVEPCAKAIVYSLARANGTHAKICGGLEMIAQLK